MNGKELSALTDEELLKEAKKLKSASITSAFLIGIMIGIVVWSVSKNTIGLFTLIPLIFAYKLLHQPDKQKELKEVLKERNLK